MTDLTRCLYEFIHSKRMSNLLADTEYQETVQGIKQQISRVESYLDAEQQIELHTLMELAYAQNDMEQEYLFQATLSLARDLSGLVHSSRPE